MRGVAVGIPPGVEFQFRTLGYEPLQIVITAMPPWPGPAEAALVEGRGRRRWLAINQRDERVDEARVPPLLGAF